MRKLSEFNYRGSITCLPEDSAYQAALRMQEQDVGSVLVMSGESLAGIITRSDLVREVVVKAKDPKKTPAKDIMSRKPILINSSATITEALKTMIREKVERLVVVSRGKVLGVISQSDLVISTEVEALSQVLRGRYSEVIARVRGIAPKLVARYSGEEAEELRKDMDDDVTALLILLEQADVALRR